MEQGKHHNIRHFLLAKARVALYLALFLMMLPASQGVPVVLAQGAVADNTIVIDDSTVRMYNVPDAVDDNMATATNVPRAIAVLANDTDSENDLLTVAAVGASVNSTATLNPDNMVTYIPNLGSTGVDVFTYTVSDPGGLTDTAYVTITAGTTIIVNTTADELLPDGDCSLREAIRAANLNTAVDACLAGGGDDTIHLPPGVYILSLVGRGENNAATGDLDITDNLEITGAGAASTIIDGQGNDGQGLDRVFHTLGAIRVTISGVTIRNGNPGAGVFGGGINNQGGALTLINSTLSNNTGSGGGGGISNGGILVLLNSTVSDNMTADHGGGIANFGTLTLVNGLIISNTTSNSGGGLFNDPIGTLTIANSTVSGNVVYGGGAGGGILNISGTLTLTNSTISGNAAGNGGGLYNNSGRVSLNNVTFTGNSAAHGGGGLYHSMGSVNFRNTLIGGNTDSSGGAPDCAGTLTSQGYNLIQSTTGCIISGTTTGNKTGTSPLLGPLQNNGGRTPTHALLAGSPAIDAGSPAIPGSGGDACEARDQRGAVRPYGAACDIGAYESGAAVYWLHLPLIARGP